MAHVCVGVPSYDDRVQTGLVVSLFRLSAKHVLQFYPVCSSALTHSFNLLWVKTLMNEQADVFVMVHADIIPDPDALVVLVEELQRLDADVVSAVSPIKTVQGTTSTGVGYENEWTPTRRLTMKEVFELPETFSSEDVKHFGGEMLVVNTGMMAVNFRRPWVREVCFDVKNAVNVLNDGDNKKLYVPQFLPEDWLFSRWLHERGLKYYATRKAKLRHVGTQWYANDHVWGTEETDPGHSDVKR